MVPNYYKFLTLIVTSPIVHSKYLRHLEEENPENSFNETSSDLTSSTEEDELSMASKIIVYATAILFGIMCLTYIVHCIATNCMGYSYEDDHSESQGETLNMAAKQRREVLEILFSETNRVSLLCEVFN